MAEVTLNGAVVRTVANLPVPGSKARDFTLTKSDLSDVSLADFEGKKIILNIFPSIDTATCAASVRQFNEEAAALANTVVLAISKDLPFAHERFCSVEGIKNVIPLTELRDINFGKDYGVRIIDGPLEGLFARAVVVIDEKGVVAYTQLVKEIADEPNYEAALAVVE